MSSPLPVVATVTRPFSVSPDLVFDAWIDTAMIGRLCARQQANNARHQGSSSKEPKKINECFYSCYFMWFANALSHSIQNLPGFF